MISIEANGMQVSLGQTVYNLKSLKIINNSVPGIQVQVPAGQGAKIMEWLYNLIQQIDGYFSYNGVLLTKDQINKPKHMK